MVQGIRCKEHNKEIPCLQCSPNFFKNRKNNHEDLRRQAVDAVSNYLHHSLFDIIPTNMMGFVREQAEHIVGCCDSAIKSVENEAKRRGILK